MRTKAFTLIELLIVIAIIAILALIAIPNFLEAQTRANVSRVESDMRSMATAIEAYTVDNRVPPMAQMGSNGLTYSNYSWELYSENANGAKSCAIDLTTPVAYLSGRFPYDPFFDKMDELDLSFPRRGSYVYINPEGYFHAQDTSGFASGVNNPARLPSPYIDVRYNSLKSTPYHIHWALACPGPDHSIRDPRTTDGSQTNLVWFLLNKQGLQDWTDGRTALYDPTNGTVSHGNIWRLSAGGMK